MEKTCRRVGMRFYVSDAHFKERCDNGSCCGLPESWNYTRGQYCEALVLARRNGEVRWSDIEADLGYAKIFPWGRAQGYNASSSERRAKFLGFTMYDYLRYTWNHPRDGQSPYQMFEGIVVPDRLDEHGDVIYVFDETRA